MKIIVGVTDPPLLNLESIVYSEMTIHHFIG
jgi:hypothetical protein